MIFPLNLRFHFHGVSHCHVGLAQNHHHPRAIRPHRYTAHGAEHEQNLRAGLSTRLAYAELKYAQYTQ